jgi:hypothetical protein
MFSVARGRGDERVIALYAPGVERKIRDRTGWCRNLNDANLEMEFARGSSFQVAGEKQQLMASGMRGIIRPANRRESAGTSLLKQLNEVWAR